MNKELIVLKNTLRSLGLSGHSKRVGRLIKLAEEGCYEHDFAAAGNLGIVATLSQINDGKMVVSFIHNELQSSNGLGFEMKFLFGGTWSDSSALKDPVLTDLRGAVLQSVKDSFNIDDEVETNTEWGLDEDSYEMSCTFLLNEGSSITDSGKTGNSIFKICFDLPDADAVASDDDAVASDDDGGSTDGIEGAEGDTEGDGAEGGAEGGDASPVLSGVKTLPDFQISEEDCLRVVRNMPNINAGWKIIVTRNEGEENESYEVNQIRNQGGISLLQRLSREYIAGLGGEEEAAKILCTVENKAVMNGSLSETYATIVHRQVSHLRALQTMSNDPDIMSDSPAAVKNRERLIRDIITLTELELKEDLPSMLGYVAFDILSSAWVAKEPSTRQALHAASIQPLL